VSDTLRAIAALVQRRSGIQLADRRLASLAAAVRRVAPDLDADAFCRLAADPVQGPPLLDRLVEQVVVRETSFLRERPQLEQVDWQALRQAAPAGTVRVWSAGCSTGEEAYTLAMLACEAFASTTPPVRILATDISTDALARAARGRYRARAVRDVEPALRARYLPADGEEYAVAEGLRRLVGFRRHNLLADPVPPLGEAPFQLVLCRNVLIYFDAETVGRVIDRLEFALAPAGQLLLGSADSLCGTARRLARPGRWPLGEAAPGRSRPLRPRAAERPAGGRDERLARVLTAADDGRAEQALDELGRLLAEDPLDADAHFARALVEFGDGRTAAAIASLRRALYVDPAFGLAAFELGRALDAAGEPDAARRAYERALRTLPDDRHAAIVDQVGLGDVAAACRARIGALS
jgi:chemotaxis protein methyltransferase CheR